MSIAAVTKIVDAFIFYNELAMLEYRLNYLSEYVDNFIIVEARQTFTGKSKELIFLQNATRFTKWADKIVHIVVDLPHGGDAWANEKFQRDAIVQGVSRIGLSDTDLVIVSDVDEIPDCKTVARFAAMGVAAMGVAAMGVAASPVAATGDAAMSCAGFVALSQVMYYYNIETLYNGAWSSARIATAAAAVAIGGYNTLRSTPAPVLVAEGGWHLSYFGNVKWIKNKIESFSHQEFNTETITNETNLQDRIARGVDLFGRRSATFTHVPKKNNSYLPPAIELLEELLKSESCTGFGC